MSTFIFKNTKGETFTVTGPPDMTQEQANAIFQQQSNSGSLVGLKPGGVLSAATQAAKGLTSAISALGQQASGVIGALGSKISSAAGQIGAVATSALNSAKSVASKAVDAVKGAFSSGPPTDGINTANYAKQATALAPVGGLSTSETTGVLAQAKKLVGQASDKLTNSKGVGSYGFDISQLEKAGYVKPGTSALVNTGLQVGTTAASKISSVLKSPSVFTGKDGVTDLKGFLSSSSTQDKTQQSLMAQGAAGLKSIGVSLGNIGSAASAGLLTSAAKSLPNTEAFIKGLPLPASVTAGINKTIKESAFAVNLTNTKIPAPFKEQTTPTPAADTTNRETVNAATNRVVGNEKIPAQNYGSKTTDVSSEIADIEDAYSEALGYTVGAIADLTDIKNDLLILIRQSSISQSDFDAVNAVYTRVKNDYTNRGVKLIAAARLFRDSKSSKAQIATNAKVSDFNKYANEFTALVEEVKELLKAVEAKVSG